MNYTILIYETAADFARRKSPDAQAYWAAWPLYTKALKDAGLVSDRREGRWAYYSLTREAFAQLEEFVGALPSTKLATNVARCCG